VDAQSYFAGDEAEDEGDTKENISRIGYYVEDSDKVANNRQYYEATYDDKSDDENTNTIDNRHEYDSSDVIQSKTPDPTPQSHPVTTAKLPLGLSKAGSVRQLISQFETLSETAVKTEPIKSETHHSNAINSHERVSNEPDSRSTSAPLSNTKINLRGMHRKSQLITFRYLIT
jgi:hypothetical protein